MNKTESEVRGRTRLFEPVVSPSWPGYVTALWAFAFGAISVYWAAGGTWLIDTIGEAVTTPAQEEDPMAVAAVWLSAIAKFAGVVAALGLLQRWGQFFPRWFLLGGGWLAASLLLLYGGASLIQQVLMVAGVVEVSATFEPVLYWHLFLWTPYWLVGGALFVLSTLYLSRCTRPGRA